MSYSYVIIVAPTALVVVAHTFKCLLSFHSIRFHVVNANNHKILDREHQATSLEGVFSCTCVIRIRTGLKAAHKYATHAHVPLAWKNNFAGSNCCPYCTLMILHMTILINERVLAPLFCMRSLGVWLRAELGRQLRARVWD